MPLNLKIDIYGGRVLATGMDAQRLLPLPGATWNDRRRAVELSLRIETFQAMRDAAGADRATFAACCTAPVLTWAAAAAASREQERALHARLGAGERATLPWQDTQGALPPWEHQRVMASAAVWCSGIYFQAEPGTGKTRAACEAAADRVRANVVDVVVVVAPRRVGATWSDEMPRWAPALRVHRLTSGSTAKRAALIARARHGDVLVLNYEALVALQEALVTLMGRVRVMTIYDEAHKLKTPTAKRTKAALALATRARWRLAMSGTPILQGAQDAWSQWFIVDLGMTFGANFVQFRREWFDENEYTHTLEARTGTLETVGQLMRRRGLRYRKAECLDLPPKMYQTLRTPMTVEQQRAYNDLAATLYAQLQSDDELTVANQLVLQLRLSQITSGFFPTDDGAVVPFAENPKMDLCVEVVEELLTTGASVIVWARYREDVRQMGLRFAAHAPVRIVGGMTDAESDAAIRAFQSGTTRVLIGNAQAGGAGLNLQRASYAVYYSQDYSLENRLQTEDRCHRGGSEQHTHVTYVDLVCEHTVDEIVADALRRKQSVAAVVTDLRAHLAHVPRAP